MASSVDNVKLGVCTIWYDGVDLGYTKGGVEVEVQTTTHEVKVDQFGETPIAELITGRTVSVKAPLAETTLENIVAIMPDSELVSDGVKAAGAVGLHDNPADGNKVTFGGSGSGHAPFSLTFKTATSGNYDVLTGASKEESTTNLVAKINEFLGNNYDVTLADPTTIHIKAKQAGVAGNMPVVKTGANIIVSPIAGGVDTTKAAVRVKSGININLLNTAKILKLRPVGTNGEDDFTIYRAACPGALNFAYQTDNERVYQADFKGYAMEDGSLFAIGDTKAFVTP